MKVKDIMTDHICCVTPDMTLENASKLMCGADIGIIPVCSENEIIGVVTDRDIVVRGISKGMDSNSVVGDIMTRDIVGISPDADIKEAVKIMSDKQIRRLPVMENKQVVGMISVGDLARCGKLDTEVAKAECGIAEMYKV